MKKFRIYFKEHPPFSGEFEISQVAKEERWIIVTLNDGTRIHIPIENINYMEEKNI